jgi:hypothetical protein
MSPPVYAILVTGKDEKRIAYARLIGIKNFDMQDYKNKKMIIINHNKLKILTTPRDDIYELQVEKNNMTLGDLRNLAFELVPLNAISITWDDDDFRAPNYISFMLNKLISSKSIAVFLKNRLEYNLANNYVFKSHFEDGNTHIMCIKLDRLRYLSKDTLEDVYLGKNLRSFNKKYLAIDNDPKLYIRIIHQNNTSPYAQDTRTEIVNYSVYSYYKESEVSEEEKAYAIDIINKYYKFFKY